MEVTEAAEAAVTVIIEVTVVEVTVVETTVAEIVGKNRGGFLSRFFLLVHELAE